MLERLKNKAVITLATISTVLGIGLSAGKALAQEPAKRIDSKNINIINAPDGKMTVQYNFDPTDPELEQIVIEKRGFDGYHKDIVPIASTSINDGKNMAMMFKAKPTKGTSAPKNYFVAVKDGAVSLYELNASNPIKNIDGWDIDPQKRFIEYANKANANSQKISFGDALKKVFAKVGPYTLHYLDNCDESGCIFYMNDKTPTTRNAATFPGFFNNFQLNRVKPEDRPALDAEMKKTIEDYTKSMNCGLDKSKIETKFNLNGTVNDFIYEPFSIPAANAECRKNRKTIMVAEKGVPDAYDAGHIFKQGRNTAEIKSNKPPYKVKVSKKYMDITIPGIVQELKEQGIDVRYIEIPASMRQSYPTEVTHPAASTAPIVPSGFWKAIKNHIAVEAGIGGKYENQKIKTTSDNGDVQRSKFNGIQPDLEFAAGLTVPVGKDVHLIGRGGAEFTLNGDSTISGVESANKNSIDWIVGGGVGYDDGSVSLSAEGFYKAQNADQKIIDGELSASNDIDLRGYAIVGKAKMGDKTPVELKFEYSNLGGNGKQNTALDLTELGGNVVEKESDYDMNEESFKGTIKPGIKIGKNLVRLILGYEHLATENKLKSGNEEVVKEERQHILNLGAEYTRNVAGGDIGVVVDTTPISWSYDRDMTGEKHGHGVNFGLKYRFGGARDHLD